MKKTLLTILFTLTLVCLFAFGASAYENDYFELDIPSDYVTSEEDDMFTAQKDGVVITVTWGDAMGDTFANITDAQKAGYDNSVKDSYKEYGTITDYSSEFAENEYFSAMAFSFNLSGGSIDGIVEGVMIIADDYLYHIVFIVTDDSLYDEALKISETFTPKFASFEAANPEEIYPDADNTVGAVSGDYYETEYYTIKHPEGFTLTDESTEENSAWTSGNASALSIIVAENAIGVNYGNLSEKELEGLKNTVKATYENLGVTTFKSLTCESAVLNGIPCVNYKIECTLYGAEVSVNGYIITSEDNIFTIEGALRNDDDYAAVEAALASFSYVGSEDVALPESGDTAVAPEEEDDGKIRYESEDKLVYFSIPEDYIEAVAADPIESQWVRYDQKASVAYATFANEDYGYLMDLSDTELKQVSAAFTEGIGIEGTEDFEASNVNVNGYKGVKLTGEFVTAGVEATAEVYMFASRDTAMALYFYFFDGEIDSAEISKVLDTLRIDADLYEKPGASPVILIAGVAVIALIVILVISKSNKNKKKAAYAQQYQAPYNPYPQNGNQQGFAGYNAPNQYGQQPPNNYPQQNAYPQNQGMNGNYNQNNSF